MNNLENHKEIIILMKIHRKNGIESNIPKIIHESSIRAIYTKKHAKKDGKKDIHIVFYKEKWI